MSKNIEDKLDKIIAKQEDQSIDLATMSARIDGLKDNVETWQNAQAKLCDNRCAEADKEFVRLDEEVKKVSGRVWRIMFWVGTAGVLGLGGIIFGCSL
jgi:hypothetical protein